MSHPNPLNVYKGSNSMADYFNPDVQPPLPLVELPDKLNPFRGDNVRIYAKMTTALPAQNIKSLPALNMLLNNPPTSEETIIEQSSGSTATSLGMIARVLYNNENTRVFVSNKVGLNRIRQLQFFGVNIELYGGPSQPAISDPRGTVQKAHRLAEGEGHFINPGQYDNDKNWAAHIRWTGPQIFKQLPEVNLFSMAMGSAGCITGTGVYLKSQKPSVKVLGVCFPVGDIIPGPRTLPLLEECSFPWKQTVDAIEIVSSIDAYRLSMSLSREGLICGPSSGMTLKGLYDFLQKSKDAGTLHEYAEPETGEISCVFVCCDLPYQHLDAYFTILGEEDFPSVTNQDLLNVDIDEYDAGWELSIYDAKTKLNGVHKQDNDELAWRKATDKEVIHPPRPSTILVLDLRSSQDFDNGHIPGSVSTPLASLTATSASPFDDVKTLESQWKDLKVECTVGEFHRILDDIPGSVILVCYNGETSRLASAIMRGQGVEAYSIKGGMQAIISSGGLISESCIAT